MKSMLEALYCGEIRPEEKIVPRAPEFRRIRREISEAKGMWKGKLSTDDFNQLETLLDLHRQTESMQADFHKWVSTWGVNDDGSVRS
ncbi:DUF6809 family protein [Paenibacillus oralis]|uniref:DUF6809 family protein n=1 Tax=Paenibacillus oralis TaxID=2490856 RepID=UPI001FE8FBDD|nr:DUF6809 family protein [Paenibacillus oralis]